MRKLLLTLSGCMFAGCFYGQVQNLFFNSYSNIGRLDFSVMPAVMYYTGLGNGFEAIAHAEDGNGNILFFVNNNGIYRNNGSLMGGSAGILIDASSTEVAITAIPGQPGRFYVIYNEELCSPLYYSIVDMNLAGSDGDVTGLNTQISSGSYAEGMEIVKKPCSEEAYLLVYECNTGIKKFDVSASGIGNESLLAPVPTPPPVNPLSSVYEGRGELDYHNGKMGIAFTFTKYAYFADFDPYTGTLSNGNLVDFAPSANSGIYGLEFSPDAGKAYISHWYQNFGNNLFQYDFSTGTVTGYHVFSDALDQFHPATGPGQIELGTDGNLYVIIDGGDEYVRISQANGTNPVLTYVPVNTTLAMGISDAIQSELFAKDTFDLILCSDTTISLFAPVIPGSTYLWSNGSTASSITVGQAGTYTVTVDGVCDKTYTYEVYSGNPSFAAELLICPGDSQQIGHEVPGGIYQWNTGDNTPYITPANSGLYTLQITVPQCPAPETDSIQVTIKTTVGEMTMPNVFTPNGDLVNDVYLPVDPPQNVFTVHIYDRWGRKLFDISDYAAGWDGKSPEGMPLPDGVYYFVAEQQSECTDKPIVQNGFFHLLASTE